MNLDTNPTTYIMFWQVWLRYWSSSIKLLYLLAFVLPKLLSACNLSFALTRDGTTLQPCILYCLSNLSAYLYWEINTPHALSPVKYCSLPKSNIWNAFFSFHLWNQQWVLGKNPYRWRRPHKNKPGVCFDHSLAFCKLCVNMSFFQNHASKNNYLSIHTGLLVPISGHTKFYEAYTLCLHTQLQQILLVDQQKFLHSKGHLERLNLCPN